MVKSSGTRSGKVYLGMLFLLSIAPFLFQWTNQPFLLDLLSRGLIIGIAALSLNLILGYGGMISLGHVAYLGIGAYCVGIPCLLYTSPSPRDGLLSRMPSSA